MTTLYPRLPPGPARRLFDEIKSLSVEQLRLRAAADHPSTVYTPIGGDRATSLAMEQMRDELVRIAYESGYPTPPNIEARGGFDMAIARYLHGKTDLTPAEAGSRDGGVWAHLALVVAPDIAFWRFSDPPGDRVLGTDLTRHVFARMWWRAYLAYDETNPSGDPYEALTVLGEAGIDQILARRRILGQSPHMFRTVLRTWRGVDREGLTERALLQDFLKRLLRIAPFISFETLTEKQLESLLLDVVLDARRALNRID